MVKYHKIQSVFKRDPESKFKNFIEGDFSLPEFEYLANNNWVFTEKVDGTNIRILWDGEKIEIRGKSDNAQIPPFLLKKLQDTFYPLKPIFAERFKQSEEQETPPQVCFYGEGYGNKIQKVGHLYSSENNFVLFDININGWWLQRQDVDGIAKAMNIDSVPIVYTGTLWESIEYVRNGFNSTWGDFPAEGLVGCPEVELQTRGGKRIITKIKTSDFIKKQ